MSLVGPRPERPEFIQQLTQQIPYYGQRHIVKPGLTGWAQVRYAYGSSVEDAMEKLQYDLFYIKHLSLGMDLLIALSTVKTVLSRRGDLMVTSPLTVVHVVASLAMGGLERVVTTSSGTRIAHGSRRAWCV